MIDTIFEDQYNHNPNLAKYHIVRRADVLLKLLKAGEVSEIIKLTKCNSI